MKGAASDELHGIGSEGRKKKKKNRQKKEEGKSGTSWGTPCAMPENNVAFRVIGNGEYENGHNLSWKGDIIK